MGPTGLPLWPYLPVTRFTVHQGRLCMRHQAYRCNYAREGGLYLTWSAGRLTEWVVSLDIFLQQYSDFHLTSQWFIIPAPWSIQKYLKQLLKNDKKSSVLVWCCLRCTSGRGKEASGWCNTLFIHTSMSFLFFFCRRLHFLAETQKRKRLLFL